MSKGKITTAVMAGGKSSRMGTDKSFVPLLGKPLIEHVLASVEGIGDELILITNQRSAYSGLGLPLYGDLYRDCGPLGGLHSALVHAAHEHVLVVACDMPWLNPSFLRFMVGLRESADVIVPRWSRHPEPLHAVYSKVCLAPIEANLRTGKLKITRFYGQVRVHFLDRTTIARYDPAGRSFSNVNTPEDLATASRDSQASQ